MPKQLEAKLKKEYPHNNHAVYGTLNKMGMMHGNKGTAKGKAYDKKHNVADKMNHKHKQHDHNWRPKDVVKSIVDSGEIEKHTK